MLLVNPILWIFFSFPIAMAMEWSFGPQLRLNFCFPASATNMDIFHDILNTASQRLGLTHTNHKFIVSHGTNLNQLSKAQVPTYRRQLGVVFQNHRLLMDRSLYDNVALPLQVSGYPRGEMGRRVRAALDSVGLLERELLKPAELSGGEQQRVGIARAIVHKPRILLADEPTGNLDPQLSAEIMALFRRFQTVGVTVLIATHDVSLINRMRLRILRLDGGILAEDSGKREKDAE